MPNLNNLQKKPPVWEPTRPSVKAAGSGNPSLPSLPPVPMRRPRNASFLSGNAGGAPPLPARPSLPKTPSQPVNQTTPPQPTAANQAPQSATSANQAPPPPREIKKTAERKPADDKERKTLGAPLTPEEKKLLKKRKGGKLQKLVKKVEGFKTPPSPSVLGKKSGGKLETAGKIASGAGTATDVAGMGTDVVTGAGDVVSNLFDAAGELDMGSLSDTVKGFSEAGQTGAQVGGAILSFAGVAASAVQSMLKVGFSIAELVKRVRAKDRAKMIDSILELAASIVGLAAPAFNAASAITGVILNACAVAFPIGLIVSSAVSAVVAAFTAAQSAITFAVHVRQMIRSDRGRKRAREQKKAAKMDIAARQEKGDEFVTGARRKDHLKMADRDYGKEGERSKRLDEYTKERRDAGAQDDKGLLTSLEDYDVSKELQSANVKRNKDIGIGMVLDDLEPFIGALISIIPGGGILSGTLSAVIGIGNLGKGAATFVRQKGRNKGWDHFDKNKSDEQKEKKRHNLALTVYSRLEGLIPYNLPVMNEDTTVEDERIDIRNALKGYNQVNDWVHGMGIGASALEHSADADQMVAMMRQGFYKDN